MNGQDEKRSSKQFFESVDFLLFRLVDAGMMHGREKTLAHFIPF